MSSNQPQDPLKLLRELLLSGDRQEVDSLRSQIKQVEKGLEESGKKGLTELLKEERAKEPPLYDKFIAALQDGTEGAIERSVRTNKARLAGALFPIMGPAIRSYVTEMFRSLAEDLNNSLQNATSLERLRWRFQARMSGVPFTEYVALKTANFRVEELYLMERGTGLLIQHLASDPDHETLKDPDLMSGMLTAIRSFTRDVFGEDLDGDGEVDDDQELDRFSFGGRQVLIEGSPTMILAAVVRGTPPALVREKMRAVLEALHEKYANAEGADASAAENAQLAPPAERGGILQTAMLEARSSRGEQGASSGDGLWRAWLFLALLVLGIAGWIGYRIWDQREWQAYAQRLEAEPGIELLRAEGPRISGLRDPEVADERLEELAQEREGAKLTFVPFHSLHPEFVARRLEAQSAGFRELQAEVKQSAGTIAELSERAKAADEQQEKLQAQLATARSVQQAMSAELQEAEQTRRRQLLELFASRFAQVEGLQWEITDGGISVSGGAPEPYYTEILDQLAALDFLGTVDSSKLTNLSGVTLEGLLAEFARTPVIYSSGTTDQLAIAATIKRLVEMIGSLNEIAEQDGQRYHFRLRSHPLIGDNREANKLIELERVESLRRALIDAGIAEERLTFELSGDIEQAGGGVEIVPVETEP